MPKTRPELLRPLIDGGYELIPLHRWDKKTTNLKGKTVERGKSPLHTNWPRRSYESDDQITHMERGSNVGVRLRARDLVIDWDPRNDDGRWGVPAFDEMVLFLDLDPTEWPRVETGSGGSHYYLTKPDDAVIVGELDDFPGVEFKSIGRQVVAPGSVHPNGRQYRWASGEDALWLGAPEAPPGLLDALQRPTASPNAGTAGGEYSAEQIATMLDALDPEEFQDEDMWRTLMMACHHASAGEARSEFQAWSWGDPLYDSDTTVLTRWDSCSAEHDGGVCTYRTLHWLMRKQGASEAIIPLTSPEEDFGGENELDQADLPSLESEDGDPVNALIEEMNHRYCAVLEGGKFVIFMEDTDDIFDPPRKVWTRMSREAFLHYYEDDRVPLPDTPRNRWPTRAKVWLKHPRRRKYPGIIMDPQCKATGGKLNLWRGWHVGPEPGDWTLMRGLIEDVLCAGDRAFGEYVLRWIAFMLQRPWEPAEVALAFRGNEGTGKGTLGRALMRIAGAHGLTVASPTQFAGRFNAHLRDVAFLFADEAFWPGHKESAGILKQLVTEPVISYEGKGRDIVPGRNLVHLMMASNEEWIVPAGLNARRFAVFDVTEERRNDRAFFGRLWAQLDSGGLAGMVHDLTAMDLGGWHPSRERPETGALADQKLLSLDHAMKWWHELLDRGSLPHEEFQPDDSAWPHGPVRLAESERNCLVSDYDSFLKRNRILHAKATHKAIVGSGRALGLETTRASGGTERIWILPALPQMRATFEERVGVTDAFL